MTQPLPVTLVGGFLGAGKTTLINQLLVQAHGLRMGVVVNDFGPMDIDGELLVGVEGEVMRLSNGCICCTLRQGLVDTVLGLVETRAELEHLVVEASGASDPAALLEPLRELQRMALIRLDGMVTVVDAEALDLDAEGELGRLQRSQVVAADILILNKMDLVSDADEPRLALTRLRPDARIIEAVKAQVPLGALLGFGGGERASPQALGHPAFRSFAWTRQDPLPFRSTFETLQGLPPEVLRAKGFVDFEERPGQKVALHLAGRRLWAQPVGDWGEEVPMTRLVFIGVMSADVESRVRAALNQL
ncbi:MAG: GTP-binding protein [Myxococcota bacterium]